jgi:hypothetical protein
MAIIDGMMMISQPQIKERRSRALKRGADRVRQNFGGEFAQMKETNLSG